MRIAYIANDFPNLVESYMFKEIVALRRLGVEVHCYSTKKPPADECPAYLQGYLEETKYLRPLKPFLLCKALWLSIRFAKSLRGVYVRVLFRGTEGLVSRLKGLSHVVQGLYFSLLLRSQDLVHIHAHHGYFASFGAMIASLVLKVPYSMTLHGSDLLVHRFYMDLKLGHCKTCFTISEYNKQFLLHQFPSVPAEKIVVRRMGVETRRRTDTSQPCERNGTETFTLLSVGRLETVKNHEFLIEACARLKKMNVTFLCLIVGHGKEKRSLQRMIERYGLLPEVKLLDIVDRPFVDLFYRLADLVVLTSRSEGIPVVLMEAMHSGKIVLAPEITGIPELVSDGKTGFLYRSGNLEDFVAKVVRIREMRGRLDAVRQTAREHVVRNFDEAANLEKFTGAFLAMLGLEADSR